MSSPSKRCVGKSSRSQLGSTGDTPSKAQQPRDVAAAADEASPTSVGESTAPMAVDALHEAREECADRLVDVTPSEQMLGLHHLNEVESIKGKGYSMQ